MIQNGRTVFSGCSVARYRAWFGTKRSSVRIWPPRQKTLLMAGSFLFMSYKVYILFSPSIKKYYTGHTQDLGNRMMEHNGGETTSIKHGIPWTIIWIKETSSKSEAIILENRIKKRGAKRFLEEVSRGAWGAKIVSSNLATPTKTLLMARFFVYGMHRSHSL
jgi:putative endonuclease